MKFRIALSIISLLLLGSLLTAQEPEKKFSFGGVGLGFSDTIKGKAIGTCFFGTPVPGLGDTYSLTAMEVSAADYGNGNAILGGYSIQYQFREFIGYKFLTMGKRFSLFAMTGGGFTAVDSNVIGSFAAGGLMDFKINDKVGIFFGPLVDYNSKKERSFLPWIGVRFKL
jgi:hypothetical protein